jgi:hypothetical protein
MSRGVGKAIGLVAAIAIPFMAPGIFGALAGSLGFQTIAASTLGSTIGSAVTGAVLGGANAALTGGNAGIGALTGALGGGFAGYSSASAAAAKAAETTAQGIAGGAAGSTPGPANLTSATVGAGTRAGAVGGSGLLPTTISAPVGGVPAAAGGATGFVPATGAVVRGANSATGGIGGAAGAVQSAGNSVLKQLFPQGVNPNLMGDIVKYGLANVLSAVPPAEQALAKEYDARLRQLQGQNDELYQRALAELDNTSPSDRGSQYATDAKNQYIAATEAAVGGINRNRAGLRAETEQRGLQEAALKATLAYRQGYDSATMQRANMIGTLGGIPRTNAAADMLNNRRLMDANRATNRAGILEGLSGLISPKLPDAPADPTLKPKTGSTPEGSESYSPASPLNPYAVSYRI